MSVKLYKYEEWKCEGEYCPGDCDRCYKADLTKEDKDVEQDGWKTWNVDGTLTVRGGSLRIRRG